MSTRDHVVRIREKNPCLTLQEIGDACGVSKQFVSQVLLAEGLPTRHMIVHQKYSCLKCGKPSDNRYFCSWSCRSAYAHIPAACEWCGKIVILKASNISWRLSHKGQKHIFCSRSCVTRYQWKYHRDIMMRKKCAKATTAKL